MSTPSPRTRIRRLRVAQIFGPGSHDIDIVFKLDERVTVLHGRNGSGKTITLRLLQALQAGRYIEVMQVPFKRLTLELEGGARLDLTHAGPPSSVLFEELWNSHGGDVDSLSLDYKVTAFGDETEGESSSMGRVRAGMSDGWSRRRLFRDHGLIEDSNSGAIIDAGTGELLTLNDLSARLGESFFRSMVQLSAEPAPLQKLREQLPEIKLIPTDRLYQRDVPDDDEPSPRGRRAAPQLMVEHLAQQIRAVVQQANAQYLLRSTQLDASLPKRLFGTRRQVPSAETLRVRREDLSRQEDRLRALGLLKEPVQELTEAPLDDAERAMFSIILEDRAAKLESFADIVNKAERLLTSLNQKLSPKQVKLDVTKGYEVLTAGGAPLPLSKLSSGEQHELVLLHELLFSIEPGTLVLLDEPELSLHVTWQETLLDELVDIAALTGIQFVLATHSPNIIGEHTDLMVRLGDPA